LEPKFIELGHVQFGTPKAVSVLLDNVGSTPARFYFVAPPKLRESQDGVMVWDENQPLCPPWLAIGQEEGEVQTGVCSLIAPTRVAIPAASPMSCFRGQGPAVLRFDNGVLLPTQQQQLHVDACKCPAVFAAAAAAAAAGPLPTHTQTHTHTGQGATITLTACVTGGGPHSACAYINANPAPAPASPNTLDTILILRLEDGADSFISLRGTFLPSCYGMDLDRLLTLGDSPVLAVEQLDAEGQQLLQQGLQPPPQLPAAALGAAGSTAGLEQQLGGLGLGAGGLLAGGSAAGGVDSGGRAGQDLRSRQGLSGVESRVPKEVQRLVHFLEVSDKRWSSGSHARAASRGWVKDCVPKFRQMLNPCCLPSAVCLLIAGKEGCWQLVRTGCA
jgi:hypothetical protein